MPLITTKKISLDFYINNYISVNAKQLDTESRYVNIACTDHGQKVILDSDTMSAFVRYKKSDGNNVFNDAVILDDGTIQLELTQQMLAVEGKQSVDIIIVASSGLSVDNLVSYDSIYSLKDTSIISTMTFYVNVIPAAIEHSRITSSSEYNALLQALSRLVNTEISMADLARIINQSIEDANSAIDKANSAANNANTQATSAKTATENANNATIAANTAKSNADDVTAEMRLVLADAEAATDRANEAAELCESIIDKTGVIMQNEKGVANGVATLDANGQITTEQVSSIYDVISSNFENVSESIQTVSKKVDIIENSFNTLHEVYSGTNAPDNSIGKNGDIYMQIIE